MKQVMVAMMAVALSGGLAISGFASNGDTPKAVHSDTLKAVHRDTLKAMRTVKSDTTDYPNDTTKRDTTRVR